MLFSKIEINNIEQLWRSLDTDHPWTGWAAHSNNPDEIWIFRSQVNWRRFILRKTESAYVLQDDTLSCKKIFETLDNLANKVGEVPALPN